SIRQPEIDNDPSASTAAPSGRSRNGTGGAISSSPSHLLRRVDAEQIEATGHHASRDVAHHEA
ncbi:MAG: hypothetical protein RIS41_1791, partial [Actinomycetota bacterium]